MALSVRSVMMHERRGSQERRAGCSGRFVLVVDLVLAALSVHSSQSACIALGLLQVTSLAPLKALRSSSALVVVWTETCSFENGANAC